MVDVGAVDEVLDLLDVLEEIARDAEANPLDYIDWLPGQASWLADAGPNPKLFRAGVRSGKTTAGCGETIFRCKGQHPFLNVPPAPVRCAMITTDKQTQGVQIMRLFHSLCGRDDLDPSTEFSERTGFRGHVPVVQFRNGSSVTWYSNNAGPQALQGAEFDYIGIDEPPDEAVFDEAQARVRNTGGLVGCTLTPLHKPVPWLRERCEKGLVSDHHFAFTLENQRGTITGELRRTKAGKPWDQAFLEDVRRREGLGPSGPIKLDGAWEMRSEAQFFDRFHVDRHTSRHFPARPLDWYLGIDYAAADREFGMCAVLSGVERREVEIPTASGRPYVDRVPYVYTLDEVVMPGTASMPSFAVAIVSMLERHGLHWHELEAVFGDNPVKSRFQRVGNLELGKHVARRLGKPQTALRPRLFSVKEGGGASSRSRRTKDVRCTWAWQALAEDRVVVHPRCSHLIRAFSEWDYTDRHPLKDILDAWHYGLRELWQGSTRRGRIELLVG